MSKKRLIITIVISVLLIALGGLSYYYEIIPQDSGIITRILQNKVKTENAPESDKVKVLQYSNPGDEYSLVYPDKWYLKESHPLVTAFSKFKDLDLESVMGGNITGPIIIVSINEVSSQEGITTPQGWLIVSGLGERDISGLQKEREIVERNGLEMIRVVRGAPNTDTDVINYAYILDPQRVVTISHFPYIPESKETKDFEELVNSFSSNVEFKQIIIDEELVDYFSENMRNKYKTEAGLEAGLVDEGFEPKTFMQIYPSLMEEDFNGVEAMLGVYEIENEEILFKQLDAELINSGARSISDEGMGTLLSNASSRLNIDITDKASVDELLLQLERK